MQKLTLRDYQEKAVKALFDYFYEKQGNPCLAMPTGSGKSLVIADFIYRAVMSHATIKILMITHVKELIKQNAEELENYWSNAPVGIYSAGLGKRQLGSNIVFGGIKSLINAKEHLGHYDLIIIDECHTLSNKDDSMYKVLIEYLKGINPNLRIVGLSATPFRIGQGYITDGGIFTDICYDITKMEEFNKLIKDGYLTTLIPKRTSLRVDVSDIKIQAGEYNLMELQEAWDKDDVTYRAVKEIIEYSENRKSWLIFCSGIKHSEHVCECLHSFGISATFVHSKMEASKRDEAIEGFTNDKYQAICNNGILTTGYNKKTIDLIAVLRHTCSPGLWVQMLGRGLRVAPGKENCLVLDFAGNTEALGPINDPVIPRRKGDKPGEIPIKICPICGVYNHTTTRICCSCGYEFPICSTINHTASTLELIKGAGLEEQQISVFKIDEVFYFKHKKNESPATLKCTYRSGVKKFDEYVCLEHAGFARKKAVDWWKQRISHTESSPVSVDEALQKISHLKIPKEIVVIINRKYPEIISHRF